MTLPMTLPAWATDPPSLLVTEAEYEALATPVACSSTETGPAGRIANCPRSLVCRTSCS
jgi:hypothetical protein